MTDTPNPENTPIEPDAAVEADIFADPGADSGQTVGDGEIVDLYGPIPFPEDQEPVVITGTIDIVVEDDTMAPGQRFPVESVPEPLPPMTIPNPSAEMAVFPVETDEARELRLEKESMSRSERLKRGW